MRSRADSRNEFQVSSSRFKVKSSGLGLRTVNLELGTWNYNTNVSRRLQPEKIERVVVRGANWVGDAVMTVPALRELRRVLPRAHITLATRAWAEGIFRGADFLDDILISDETASAARSVLREARGWRARRFDLAVLFPNA